MGASWNIKFLFLIAREPSIFWQLAYENRGKEDPIALLDLVAEHFILFMSTYETYCWQIYRLDYPRLGPVKEHRETGIRQHDTDWLFICLFQNFHKTCFVSSLELELLF